MSTMPAYAYALTVFPSSDTGAEGIDPPRHLMARHARILNPRPKALFNEHFHASTTDTLRAGAPLLINC